jgi:hypothetical protein
MVVRTAKQRQRNLKAAKRVYDGVVERNQAPRPAEVQMRMVLHRLATMYGSNAPVTVPAVRFLEAPPKDKIEVSKCGS